MRFGAQGCLGASTTHRSAPVHCYCLSITLRQHLKAHAPGLMPRAVFEKMATLQMLDVHIPVNTGAELILRRHSEPDEQTALLLDKLELKLPGQPPTRIRYPETTQVPK